MVFAWITWEHLWGLHLLIFIFYFSCSSQTQRNWTEQQCSVCLDMMHYPLNQALMDAWGSHKLLLFIAPIQKWNCNMEYKMKVRLNPQNRSKKSQFAKLCKIQSWLWWKQECPAQVRVRLCARSNTYLPKKGRHQDTRQARRKFDFYQVSTKEKNRKNKLGL